MPNVIILAWESEQLGFSLAVVGGTVYPVDRWLWVDPVDVPAYRTVEINTRSVEFQQCKS